MTHLDRRIFVGCFVLSLAACLESRRGAVDVLDTSDIADTADTAVAPETLTELPCDCAEGEVYRHGSCVPTLALGCGPSCDSTGCGDALQCSDCAASTSCGSRDCRPACAVPYAPHAVVPEPLRVDPTHLPAGEGGALVIEGTSFYVGALGHSVRLGDTPLTFHGHFMSSECAASIQVPSDTASGTYPLWVSQYSGGEPWVLAGIVHVGDALVCAQPGFPCAAAADCCTAPGLELTCSAGRCRRPE